MIDWFFIEISAWPKKYRALTQPLYYDKYICNKESIFEIRLKYWRNQNEKKGNSACFHHGYPYDCHCSFWI